MEASRAIEALRALEDEALEGLLKNKNEKNAGSRKYRKLKKRLLSRAKRVFFLKCEKIVFLPCHRLQQFFIANELAKMSKSFGKRSFFIKS